MPITDPAIQADHVSFAYAGTAVLEDVSFAIPRGDYVGVVGPNGGGKTTLVKILLGLLKPQSGRVAISGAAAGTRAARRDIGYVPQRTAPDAAAFPATVYEIVESGRMAKKSIFGSMRAEDRRAVTDALKTAGIAHLKNRLMAELSGGERQRAWIARALAANPHILILDEPFAGVDAGAQKEFYAFLKDLNAQGLTILFVSHDIDVIMHEARSLLCLNRGLLCFGSPDMVREQNIMEHLYGKHVTHLHHPSL